MNEYAALPMYCFRNWVVSLHEPPQIQSYRRILIDCSIFNQHFNLLSIYLPAVMGDKYLGCLVSIDCGDNLGYYQGEVCHVDAARQTLTLKDVFHNGLKSPLRDVTIYAKDITNLSIISSQSGKSHEAQLTPAKQKATVTTTAATLAANNNLRDSPRKFVPYHSQSCSSPNSIQETPGKGSKKNRGKGVVAVAKDGGGGGGAGCFGIGDDINMEQEFDFETNLALFDKKAVMGKIQASLGPNNVDPTMKYVVPKYGHDENVLESLPPLYRQIRLPFTSKKEFLTGNFFIFVLFCLHFPIKLVKTLENCFIYIYFQTRDWLCPASVLRFANR